MSDDPFSMPDMDEIARQMEEAMAEAQHAMDGLPQLVLQPHLRFAE